MVGKRPAESTVFCQEHLPMTANPNQADNYPEATGQPAGASTASNPYVHPSPAFGPVAPVETSPGLAFFLGWIPGVGAIYNGQYVNGLVHAVIFGLRIRLVSSA